MKMKTIAPKCVRVLSIVSMALSVLWILAYILLVLFQREIRPLFMTDSSALEAFYVPVASLIGNALPLLIQLTAAILICASGKKVAWATWSALTLLLVKMILAIPSGLVATAVSTYETVRVNTYGTAMVVAYSTVSTTIAYASYFLSAANMCMLVALTILCYRCMMDARAQRTGSYDV